MSAADMLAALVAANLAISAGILAVIVARRPVRRLADARVAYALWLIPLLAGLATLLPARPASAVPAVSAPVQPIADAMMAAVDLWPAQLAAPAATPGAQPFDLPPILLAIWAAGAGVMLAVTLIRQRRSFKAFGTITREGGAMRASGNAGPALVGVVFPQLVIPADFEQRFSGQERTLILAHERAHLSSGDTRINALVVLLACLNWFNPLVHVAARLVRTDQELACDAAVVDRFPGERRVYAEALLKTQLAPALLPLGCTWPPRSSNLLKERVTMLARQTPGSRARIAGAALIAATGLGFGLAAWASKPVEPATAPHGQPTDKAVLSQDQAAQRTVDWRKQQTTALQELAPEKELDRQAEVQHILDILSNRTPPSPEVQRALNQMLQTVPPSPEVQNALDQLNLQLPADSNSDKSASDNPQEWLSPTLTCDDWRGIWGGDSKVEFKTLKKSAPVVFAFDDSVISAVDISAMSAAFPREVFPEGLAPGEPNSGRMTRDSASYRVASKTLIDSFTLGSLDRDRPSVTWHRIRIDADGPHEIFMEGLCRK